MAADTVVLKREKVPASIKRFLIRGALIFAVWKVLYLAVLAPTRLVDKPLTYSVGHASAWMLNRITAPHNFVSKDNAETVSTENGPVLMQMQTIYAGKQKIVSIEDGCNALELFVLYAGFIICLPALLRDKLIFITGGILMIYIVNVLRCAGIGYVILHYPQHADFTHHYVFTFIVYGFIMLLWYFFAQRVIVDQGSEYNEAAA